MMIGKQNETLQHNLKLFYIMNLETRTFIFGFFILMTGMVGCYYKILLWHQGLFDEWYEYVGAVASLSTTYVGFRKIQKVTQ